MFFWKKDGNNDGKRWKKLDLTNQALLLAFTIFSSFFFKPFFYKKSLTR
jgi:hypothetical protein